ncbi:MAG: hypothetical protein AMXMBFR58_37920 [Phycisphaerae bacterium]
MARLTITAMLIVSLGSPLACEGEGDDTSNADSGVHATGGAAGGGSGGSAGADGSPASCEDMANDYAGTLLELKACNTLVDYECVATAWKAVDCDCPTFVNGAFSLERDKLKAKLEQLKADWKTAGCAPSAPCTCSPPTTADCAWQGGPPGGTCNDSPGGG